MTAENTADAARVTGGDVTSLFSPCARVREEKAEMPSPAVTSEFLDASHVRASERARHSV
jgi:hypothetical protein